MEQKVYTIPEEKREEIGKIVARLSRKAEKYGKAFSVTYGNPYATKRDYIDKESGRVLESELVEVFDITIEAEQIIKDGYRVIARLEHLDNGNIVTNFTEIRNPAWNQCPPCCEHCMTAHYRRFTYIVEGKNCIKQVGSSCLMDYCGISPNWIIAREQIDDVLCQNDLDCSNYPFGSPVSHVYDVTEMLALSVQITEKQGYIKSEYRGSNKDKLTELCENFPDEKYMEKAREIVEGLKAMDEETAFFHLMNNVKQLAENGYCKPDHFGYIAYAPTAYRRYTEKLAAEKARQAEKEKQRASSDYIGNVGERVDIEIGKAEFITSWQTAYGYTHLYKFEDVNGNILVWFASSFLTDDELKNCGKIKATIKEHSERDGVKQTIITRVKVA